MDRLPSSGVENTQAQDSDTCWTKADKFEWLVLKNSLECAFLTRRAEARKLVSFFLKNLTLQLQ